MSSSNYSAKEKQLRADLIAQMHVLGQTVSTETALFHQTAAATFGLDITSMKTLSILMQEGPMAAGQIAKRLSLTTGAVTNLIDRLERRNLVSRRAHETDRRKVLVVACEEGVGKDDTPYHSMGRSFAKMLQNYTTEQLEFLVQYFKDTHELTKQEIAKVAKRSLK